MGGVDSKRIPITLVKPRFQIGEIIYVPQKNRVVETRIVGYNARIGEENENLLEIVLGYDIQHYVSVRRGIDSTMTGVVMEKDFYSDKNKAQQASEFLEVNVEEEAWKLAIGDRSIEDENSPYLLGNCNLSLCCANLSEARDILLYCKNNKGLVVHDRDELAGLLNGHGREYDRQSPIVGIFEQLKID